MPHEIINGWSYVMERAIKDDGTLFFPQRLTKEFLESAKRRMGSFFFANQYQNEVIPADAQSFKKEWFQYYSQLPKTKTTFCFIDPAISQADTADYTGISIVDVDPDNNWFVRVASRLRLTPTQIVKVCFDITDKFKPNIIGIEDVAYQKALLYFLDEEMRRRNTIIPVTGVRPPSDKSKETKILGLVPRFEWGRIRLNQGLVDLETELLSFPRGKHDDIIDSLAMIDTIAYAPSKDKPDGKRPAPNSPGYESWYINELKKKGQTGIERQNVEDYYANSSDDFESS